jgi:2'-5' RNA ligase
MNGSSRRSGQAPTHRLFVALDLPSEVRDAIGLWGKAALADPALRIVKRGSLHITLLYLGHRSVGEVPRISSAIRECIVPAPLIMLRDPEARPPSRRPRIFALPAIAPGVEQLQLQMREVFAAKQLYEPEDRAIWPHVTVARARTEGGGSRRPMRVIEPPAGPLPDQLAEGFWGSRITLYRSELDPAGVQHLPVAHFELPVGSGAEAGLPGGPR